MQTNYVQLHIFICKFKRCRPQKDLINTISQISEEFIILYVHVASLTILSLSVFKLLILFTILTLTLLSEKYCNPEIFEYSFPFLYVSLLIVDHKSRMGLAAGGAGGHSINLVRLKTFF